MPDHGRAEAGDAEREAARYGPRGPTHRGPAVGETLDPERVYERSHELLGDVVRHDGLVVSSYDAREDLIRCEYAWVDGNVVERHRSRRR